jgi:hypothetical protein
VKRGRKKMKMEMELEKWGGRMKKEEARKKNKPMSETTKKE